MLFKSDLAQKIMAGEKTQTRRVQLPGDEAIRDNTGRIVAVTHLDKNGCRRLLYHVDFSYAVQPGRGNRGIGRITIVQIRDQRVRDISPVDCLAEGIDEGILSLTDNRLLVKFRELWDSINATRGYTWAANPWVWAITFRRM